MNFKGKFAYIIGDSKNIYLAEIIGEVEDPSGFHLMLRPIGFNTKKGGNVHNISKGFRSNSITKWFYKDFTEPSRINGHFEFFDSEEELMAYFVVNHLQE